MKLKKILTFIMLCVLIVGCSKSSIQGDWHLLSLEQNGVIIKGEQLNEMYSEDIIYHFEKNGVLLVEIFGQEVEGQWEEKGEKVIIKYNDSKSELTKADGKLRFEKDGVIFVLEKQ